MLKISVAYTVFTALFISYSFAGEFDDFIQAQQPDSVQASRDFNQYKQDMDQQFKAYKRIVQEEHTRYTDKSWKIGLLLKLAERKNGWNILQTFTPEKLLILETILLK